MFVPDWFTGYLVGIIAIQLLLLGFLLRRRHGDRGDDSNRDDAVTCPACDAPNRTRYRYCRDCAAELPGATGPLDRVFGRE